MGKRAVKMFLKGLLQSFFIVVILLGAGILGYRLTMKTLQAPKGEAIIAYQDETVPESIVQAKADDISKNLIYCYNKKTGEITKIVLEVFNSYKKQLTYITVPMRAQLTMSDSLYRKMVAVNPQIPQVMLLSSMSKYLASDTVFEYGVLLLEDLLGTDISYYTAIPQSTYDTIFTGTAATDTDGGRNASGEGDSQAAAEENLSSGQKLPVETFTKEYIKFLQTLKTQEDINTYIKSLYPPLSSNLPLEDKLSYAGSYYETPVSSVSFELIAGDNQNSAFLINREQVSERLGELTGDIPNG